MIAEGAGGAAEVENLLARGYDRLDRVKEAVEAYQRAIRLEPKAPSHYFDLGLMALRRRSYELAQAVLETASATCPRTATSRSPSEPPTSSAARWSGRNERFSSCATGALRTRSSTSTSA